MVRDDEGWCVLKYVMICSPPPFFFISIKHYHGRPRSSYLKIALKSEFFDFFQPLCFWKAETELEMDLLEFLGSKVI